MSTTTDGFVYSKQRAFSPLSNSIWCLPQNVAMPMALGKDRLARTLTVPVILRIYYKESIYKMFTCYLGTMHLEKMLSPKKLRKFDIRTE